MTVSAHTSKIGVTGAVQAGSVSITDTDACQDEVVTITLANGIVLTATEGTVESSTNINAMTFIAPTSSSGSKRIAAALSLANALNANSNLTASADTYAVTITEVYGGTGGSIVSGDGMTEVDWSGGVDSAEKADSGLILNSGTPDATQSHMNSPTTAKSLREIVSGRKVVGSQLVINTGTSYESGTAKANSSGTFGYNPSSSVAKRAINFAASAPDSGFIIRSGVVNKIAGTALNPILSGGSDTTSRPGGNIHVPNGIHKYSRKGTWATTIFDVYGGGLLQSDGTAKAGITGRGSDASLAVDHAATPTRAIPGEMTLLFNFVTFTTNNLDYSAITGS